MNHPRINPYHRRRRIVVDVAVHESTPDQSIPHASLPMLTTGGGGNGRDVGVDHSNNSYKLSPATAASARPPLPRPGHHNTGSANPANTASAWPIRQLGRDGGVAETAAWPRRRLGRDDVVADTGELRRRFGRYGGDGVVTPTTITQQ
jgi:hypothetical protein